MSIQKILPFSRKRLQYAYDNTYDSNNQNYGNPRINHTVSTWSPETKNANDATIMLGTRYFGDYYNWYAATAESGTYNMDTSNYHTGESANDSLCPKGWKLPSGDINKNDSWVNLIDNVYKYIREVDGELVEQDIVRNDAIAAQGAFRLPLSVSLTGTYSNNASLHQRGIHSYEWSSRATNQYSSQIAFYMLTTGSSITSNNYSSKNTGFTIRCVSRD